MTGESGWNREAPLDAFVTDAPAAMAMFDSEMRYIAVSKRWLSDYGLERSPVGLLHLDVFPEITEDWKSVHRRCLAGAVESSEGEPFLRANGSVQWIRWSVRPWRDRDGAVGGIIITSEDVTARKEAEAEAARLASVVTHSSDAIIATTLNSIVTSWNAGATRLLGYRAKEMVGQSIVRIIPPDRLAEENQILERLRAGEAIETFETQRVARDGSVLDVSLSVAPVRDARGDIVGASKIMRDVTARTLAQRELAATAAILAAEHESSPDGILVVDTEGRTISHNRRFREMFDIPMEVLESDAESPSLSLALKQVPDPDAFLARVRYLRSHPQECAQDELALSDGRFIDRLTSPFATSDGRYLGRIWFFHDITERRRAEATLRASEERFRSLIEEAPDAILVYDCDRARIVAANKAAERLYGVSRDDLLGQEPQRFLASERPQAKPLPLSFLQRFYASEQLDGQSVAESFLSRQNRALAGEEVTFERRIVRPSGDVRFARATLVRLSSDARMLRASLVDITEQHRAQHELAETAAILETEHDSSPDGILVVDLAGRYLSVNRRYVEIFGIPPELLAARDDEAMRAFVWRQKKESDAGALRVQYLYDHPEESSHEQVFLEDGRVLDRLTSPFKTADGKILGRIWFIRDITERRRAEESLRASEERFRMLVEAAPDAIGLYDVDQDRLVAVNGAAERLFGVSREEILSLGTMRFYALEQPDGRPGAETFYEYAERALAGELVTYERRIRRPSGEERLCRVTLVRLPSSIRLLRASFVDVTDQRAAEAQLSEIALSVIRRQEEERQRIARELHDSVGQYLAGMRMKLDALGRRAPEAAPRSELADLMNMTATVGTEVSRLAWELRPAALDDLGLEPAIERLVEAWARRSGLRFDLHCTLNGLRLPSDVETTLYRVLQEAITNVVKHAGAQKVAVILEASPRGVILIVEDDGKGFELEALNCGTNARFGLLGMRERLALIHGSLEIETKTGAGTTLLMRAPNKDLAAR